MLGCDIVTIDQWYQYCYFKEKFKILNNKYC